MSEPLLSELGRSYELVDQAGDIDQARPEAVLAPRAVERAYRRDRYQSYRDLRERLLNASRSHKIEDDYYQTSLGRLKDIFHEEWGERDFEAVFGPERPSARELGDLVNDLETEGYPIIGIGRPEDYQVHHGQITGSVAVLERDDSSRPRERAVWYPVVDGQLLKECRDEMGVHVESMAGYANLEQTPWHFTRHRDDERVYGVGRHVRGLFIDGQSQSRLDYFRINTLQSGRFDDLGRFSGYVRGTDYSQATPAPENVVFVQGEMRREIAGQAFKDVSHLIIHDDATVSAMLTIQGEKRVFVFRDQVIPNIEDQPITYVHWLAPDRWSDTYTGIFGLENGKVVLVFDGEVREGLLTRKDQFTEYREFQVVNGKLSGIVRNRYTLHGNAILSDRLILNDKLIPMPVLHSTLPRAHGGTAETQEIHGLSISSDGKPSFAYTEHRHEPSIETAIQVVINGMVCPLLPGATIENLTAFHTYDGQINGKVQYITSTGERIRGYIILGRIIESGSDPS